MKERRIFYLYFFYLPMCLRVGIKIKSQCETGLILYPRVPLCISAGLWYGC
jgi:hypothetical protein